MKNLIKWFAGFLEDQTGFASSKRLVLYIFCFFMYMIVKGSLQGKQIDFEILYIVAGTIAFLVGAITSEFLAKIFNVKKKKVQENGTNN